MIQLIPQARKQGNRNVAGKAVGNVRLDGTKIDTRQSEEATEEENWEGAHSSFPTAHTHTHKQGHRSTRLAHLCRLLSVLPPHPLISTHKPSSSPLLVVCSSSVVGGRKRGKGKWCVWRGFCCVCEPWRQKWEAMVSVECVGEEMAVVPEREL